jgi:serine/threonine-protein kinase
VFVKAIDYKYAPKLVKLHKAHTDPEYFHRFLAAAGKIKQLYHPFIGELNDYTLLPSPDGEIFPTMIMPYYDGVSGNKIGYHLGPISPRKMAGAIHQVATGIDYLHAHNIVHCDIAPKNILFLTGSGTTPHALMIDFGVAYDCDEDAYLTPRENWGTAQYMAPEVFRHGLPTFASDQYSLGVTALEMMTQTTLSPLLNFEGLKIKDRLPRSISKVIGKATSINPQERFGTCTEFSEELYEAVNLHLQRGKDS